MSLKEQSSEPWKLKAGFFENDISVHSSGLQMGHSFLHTMGTYLLRWCVVHSEAFFVCTVEEICVIRVNQILFIVNL